MSTTLSQAENDLDVASSPRFAKTRLGVLMFLGYAIMGAWVPVFSLHLQNLGFSPDQTALASATNAMATLIAPLIWGQIADRWLAAERCISLCALAACALLWLLAALREPWQVILVCIVSWFFIVPLVGLANSFTFRQLEHPERDFGKIRMWGTLGWVGASWCLSLWFMALPFFSRAEALDANDLSASLRLGGVAALFLAIYALTLPHAPPSVRVVERTGLLRLVDAPLSALRLFRDRSFVVYCVCFFGVYLTMPFATQLNPLLLNKIGVDSALLPVYLTMAQSTEVVLLAMLPMLLSALGMKATMRMGNLALMGGFLVMSLGTPSGLVLCALAANGVFIGCFIVAGQVFVNRQATHDIRASAQALLLFMSGSGLLLGHMLVGGVRDWTGDSFSAAYSIAAGIAGAVVLVFSFGFAPVSAPAISSREPLVPDSEIA